MRMVRLGRTNVEVPAVSLGTWGHGGPRMAGETSVGWSGHDDQLAMAALLEAHAAGITHWDTADVYGDGQAETLIGRVWSHIPRTAIFLATKVGWDRGPFEHFYHPEQMRLQLERSLRNLNTAMIDLYYFHHCDFGPADEHFDDALEVMRRFQEEGKIRFIGLSDWDSRRVLRFIDRVDPDVVQPYRNLLDDTYVSSGLREWVDQHDAGVAFFSPLKHGLLLGKYSDPVEFPIGDFRRGIPEFSDPAALARVARNAKVISARYADHPQPVLHALLGTILGDAPTGCVLLGQRNPAQVKAAASAGDVMSFEESDWVRNLYKI